MRFGNSSTPTARNFKTYDANANKALTKNVWILDFSGISESQNSTRLCRIDVFGQRHVYALNGDAVALKGSGAGIQDEAATATLACVDLGLGLYGWFRK